MMRPSPEDEDLLSTEKKFIKKYFSQDGRVCYYKRVNRMYQGSSFGEVINNSKQTRTATVIA